MTAYELLQIIVQNIADGTIERDAQVWVGCQGYSNYEDGDNDTTAFGSTDGKNLFIVDSCGGYGMVVD